MSKQIEWAKDYIYTFDKTINTTSGATIGGVELQLYKLAKAIIADMYGDMP